ncbi:MAG: AMP-binding protein [Spirochaetota bacterium]|nr:AMP-binding protein [Spirochaetota bacterium]
MDDKLNTNLMRRVCIGDMIRKRVINEPQKEVIVFSYKGKIIRRLTIEELNREANRFANAIMELGVKKGDRVAIFSHNCVQYVDLLIALSKMGGWITPINFALKSREILPIVNHSETVMLVVEDELADTIMEVVGEMHSVKHKVMINLSGNRSIPEGWLDFDELCSEKYSDDEPMVEINDNDVLTLMYTSGTEAMPKGVLNSHLNWFSSIMNFCMDFGRWSPPEGIQLGAIPLFHVAGHLAIFLTLVQGDKFVLLYTPDPSEVMQIIKSEKINSIGLPPTVFVNMLNMPDGEKLMKELFGTVRSCTIFGSPIPEATMRRIMEILPEVYWQNYYGQSELTPLGTTLKSPDLLRKFGEAEERFDGAEPIGQSHAVVEMRVVDDDDNEVPPGTVGEMVVRSPTTMLGYYKEEEKTRETFRGGWHHTGDLAIMDEERYYYFVDRKKDIIKTGAENVSSIEVENWVAKHPKVAECTAVGLIHERWGEAVTIFVSPKPGDSLSEDEIIQHCKQGLAGYKVPKKVVVLDELPKNPSGKILKKNLRKEYSGIYNRS